jgi:hypothetical protein
MMIQFPIRANYIQETSEFELFDHDIFEKASMKTVMKNDETTMLG